MGSESTTEINVAYPEAGDLYLTISVGACRLTITPGEGGAWVTGTYTDPSGALPAKVVQEGGRVRISHEPNWSGIFGMFGNIPTLNLSIGKARPYMLTLETGASDAALDVGGVPLTRLRIKQGAGKLRLDCSAENPEEMSLFSVSSGAGSIEAANLSNLNFVEMTVDGGAAAYKLDFGGVLRRNAHARISTGASSVEVSVPASTAAKINTETPMGSLDIGDGFTKREGAFWTEGAIAGSAPVLTVQASVALGSLRIRVT